MLHRNLAARAVLPALLTTSLSALSLSALSQSDAGFSFPLNAVPASYSITGLPYGAEITRKEVKTLADGRQTISLTHYFQARDSQGRTMTRVDCNDCALTVERTKPYQVLISDPVAHRTIHLYPKQRQAFVYASRATVDFPVRPQSLSATSREMSWEAQKPQRESLGTRTIAGFAATGLRWTHTVSTGEARGGNEVVTERWYSEELKIQLLARVNNPQLGETTEEVTNLEREEPDPSLFQIPDSYSVQTFVAPAYTQPRQN
jgi:hypothetical protein